MASASEIMSEIVVELKVDNNDEAGAVPTGNDDEKSCGFVYEDIKDSKYTRPQLLMSDSEFESIVKELMTQSKENEFSTWRHCCICQYFLGFFGLLSSLLFLLPALLICLLFAFITHLCNCFCCRCDNRSKVERVRDYLPRKTLNCCCCWPYASYFFARWRLHLIMNKSIYFSKYCCYLLVAFWHLQDIICGSYQNYQILLPNRTSEFGVKDALYLVNDLAMKFGDYFPFGYGIGTVNSQRILNESLEKYGPQCRDSNLGTIFFPPAFLHYGNHTEPTRLDTDSEEHGIGKDYCLMYFKAFEEKMKFGEKREEMINNAQNLLSKNNYVLKEINEESVKVLSSQMARVFFAALFDNYVLSDEECEEIFKFSTVGIAGALTSKWTSFFVFGYFLERVLNEKYISTRDIILKQFQKGDGGGSELSDTVITLVNHCYEKKRSLVDCVDTIQIQTEIGGMPAILHLVKGCLYHVVKDPRRYSEMFYKNKYHFILESARFGNALTFVKTLAKDEEMVIGGNKCLIPKGTRLAMLHLNRCHDPAIFGQNDIPTDEFHSERQGLKEATVWNVPEKLFETKEILKKHSKRYCPAHDIGLFVTEMVVEFYTKQILSNLKD